MLRRGRGVHFSYQAGAPVALQANQGSGLKCMGSHDLLAPVGVAMAGLFNPGVFATSDFEACHA
jgi:hypothetical protein